MELVKVGHVQTIRLLSPHHVNDFENSKEFLCALLYNLFSNHVYRTGSVGFPRARWS